MRRRPWPRRWVPAVAAMLLAVLAVLAISALSRSRSSQTVGGATGMAVEFMNHAAAAYVARDHGWYAQQGLRLSSYASYVTGMALASALARREIQVAYMCLVPAINAYANAGVRIKIVAGTHRYGYALVVNPKVVARVEHLARDGVRLGSVREGGAVDLLMNRTIERHHLDRSRVLRNVRRMNPPRLLLAMGARQLDASFMPEQWASMAEDRGFQVLLTARDVWPGMQGSVLVVKEELIRDHPARVRELVAVTHRATQWIGAHTAEAAEILVRALSIRGGTALFAAAAPLTAKLAMSREMMLRSMRRLEYTTAISRRDVQQVIDFAARLGYIKHAFPAEELLDTRFMP